MKKLEGIKGEDHLFKDLYKVGDLVYMQGPLLSLFSNDKGDLYLFDWSDCDDKFNRWLVFRITLEQLNQYLKGKVSHYQLITTHFTDTIYSVDIDDEWEYHNIYRLNVDEIPEDYLPEKHVLHSDDESPHMDLIKAFISELEIAHEKKKKEEWVDKYHTNISMDLVIFGAHRIFNREQFLSC